MKSEIGIIGIGVMGKNLALNMTSKNYTVSAYDIDLDHLNELKDAGGSRVNIFSDLQSFTISLNVPRKVMLMVKSGDLIDTLILELLTYLSDGDIIIDGGNSHFEDTERRYKELSDKNIHYLGVGVSGGAVGARHGPSLMVGGHEEVWGMIRPIFRNIAAKNSRDLPCVAWMGTGGAGHFVKTIHNGIEYADMQMISEVYHLLKSTFGMNNGEIAQEFDRWNTGVLESYLFGITAKILNTTTEEGYLIDRILDKAGQKGTGRWSVEIGLKFGLPVLLMSAAVNQRILSSMKEIRSELASVFTFNNSPDEVISLEDIHNAMYVTRILAYIEGFHIISEVKEVHQWNTDIAGIARIWQAGCIIRSKLLEIFEAIFQESQDLLDIFSHIDIRDNIHKYISSLQKMVIYGTQHNIPLPVSSAALQFLTSMTHKSLPANLLQAQRDYFGSHGFEIHNSDDGPIHHGPWSNS